MLIKSRNNVTRNPIRLGSLGQEKIKIRTSKFKRAEDEEEEEEGEIEDAEPEYVN